jgi:hypothetical protein
MFTSRKKAEEEEGKEGVTSAASRYLTSPEWTDSGHRQGRTCAEETCGNFTVCTRGRHVERAEEDRLGKHPLVLHLPDPTSRQAFLRRLGSARTQPGFNRGSLVDRVRR